MIHINNSKKVDRFIVNNKLLCFTFNTCILAPEIHHSEETRVDEPRDSCDWILCIECWPYTFRFHILRIKSIFLFAIRKFPTCKVFGFGEKLFEGFVNFQANDPIQNDVSSTSLIGSNDWQFTVFQCLLWLAYC